MLIPTPPYPPPAPNPLLLPNLSHDTVAMLTREGQLDPKTKRLRKVEVDLSQATQRIKKLEAIVQMISQDTKEEQDPHNNNQPVSVDFKLQFSKASRSSSPS